MSNEFNISKIDSINSESELRQFVADLAQSGMQFDDTKELMELWLKIIDKAPGADSPNFENWAKNFAMYAPNVTEVYLAITDKYGSVLGKLFVRAKISEILDQYHLYPDTDVKKELPLDLVDSIGDSIPKEILDEELNHFLADFNQNGSVNVGSEVGKIRQGLSPTDDFRWTDMSGEWDPAVGMGMPNMKFGYITKFINRFLGQQENLKQYFVKLNRKSQPEHSTGESKSTPPPERPRFKIPVGELFKDHDVDKKTRSWGTGNRSGGDGNNGDRFSNAARTLSEAEKAANAARTIEAAKRRSLAGTHE